MGYEVLTAIFIKKSLLREAPHILMGTNRFPVEVVAFTSASNRQNMK
jgi:hypothetical protein